MTSGTELSKLDDVALTALLKSKKKLKNWTVGEILEVNKRGKDFLSNEPALKSAIKKVQSDLSKNVTEALKPILKDLGTQADIARKFAEQFQGIGEVVRKSLADQANIKNYFDKAWGLGKISASESAMIASISKLIESQTESSRKLISDSQFAISPAVSKLVGAQSQSYKSMIAASQFAINPAISNFIGAQSEAMKILSSTAMVKFSPAIESMAKAVPALTTTNSASEALALSVKRQVDTFKDFSEKLTKTQLDLKADLAPSILNRTLGLSELNLVANDSKVAKPLIVRILNKVEQAQEALIVETSRELIKSSGVTNSHLESMSNKMSAGAVSPKLIYVGIFAGIVAAITGIVAAIEGAILLFK